jgi:hypothetical protein
MDTVKTIDTPYNNAVAIFNRTNELLNENNILDSTGTEIAQLEQNVANPAWLFALACGNLHTSWQEQIAKAYAALDPQNCEDDQVLVLASLAGIKRGNGTPTHITVLITNTSDNAIEVPIGTTFTETYANQTWVLNKNVSLNAHGQQYVTLYTTTDGVYDVPSGISYNYDGELQIICTSSSSSSGGSTIESLSSLRNRISQGEDTSNAIIQAKTAIELLSGIESCSIWFNQSSTDSLPIGDGSKSIPQRNAYISIKGYDYSGKLAETYFTYLDVPATVGEQQEEYMIGQQPMSLNFDYSQGKTISIYVKILSADKAVGAEGAIKTAILAHSGTLSCGANITSQQISEWVQNLGYGTIVSCNVGSATGIISDIAPDEYVVFDEEHIFVTDDNL